MEEKTLKDLIGPIMVDPSILVSRSYLSYLSNYEGTLYIPSSFDKLIKRIEGEEKYSEDYIFFTNYLPSRSYADVSEVPATEVAGVLIGSVVVL